jgi:hypothetical protein
LRRRRLLGWPQDLIIDERTHRRHRLVRAATDSGSAIEIFRNLPAEGNEAAHGVEQQNGEECQCCEPDGMSQRKENNARDRNERSRPGGRTRFSRHLVQRLTVLHHVLGWGREPAGELDCFGNLIEALTFFPERAAGVAECRVSEHAGLIHAFDAGYDPGPQQQSTLFDQVGHFCEVQPGIAQRLRGAVLGGLGRDRILRVHLLHSLFQECHVIDHRKTASGDSRLDRTARSSSPLGAANRCARSFPTIAGFAGTRPTPSVAAVSTLFIWNCAGKLHLYSYWRATIPGNSK